MTIHFICSGNTYRSRLAEAYLNSKHIQRVKCISSGVMAERGARFPIRWYTEKILEQTNLSKFASRSWAQTSQQLVKKSDYVIVFTQKNYTKVKKYLTQKQVCEIWDIPDVDSRLPDGRIIRETNKTFQHIKRKIDELVKSSLKKTRSNIHTKI